MLVGTGDAPFKNKFNIVLQ